jgi:sulfate transport system ATP-binding protein
MEIRASNVTKAFGPRPVLRGVDLHVPSGGIVALLGPSGCGKTTLLRILAGLELPDAGSVLFEGRDVGDIHPRARGVGFVFQHYALFSHMSVFENVAFGLRVRPRGERLSERAIRERVSDLLALVRLEDIALLRPTQLSGGQRQRVALARALAVQPRVLLLDEPLSALDAAVRKDLRQWLRRLHDDLGVTSVFVTHDQAEAMEVADRVAVMNEGRVEQTGRVEDLYARPASAFVAGFLGESNVLSGRVEGGRLRVGGWWLEAAGAREGAAARVFVRPHDLDVRSEEHASPANVLARVRHATPQGAIVRLELQTDDGETLRADVLRHDDAGPLPHVGARVRVGLRRSHVFFDAA